MESDSWIETEYKALRQEILALSAAEQSAVKFFLPTAGAVLGVPYLVKVTDQPYLWAISAGVAGLLVLSMINTLHASVDGVRRIGLYIKEGIEPRTQGGLRWEHVVYCWDERSTFWLSETFAISFCAVVATVAATVGAAMQFLADKKGQYWPIVVAILIAGMSIRPLYRIAKGGKQRTAYGKDVRDFLRRLDAERNPR